MGMSIDKAIRELEILKKNTFSYMSAHQAFITAIETMRKYQKIEQIVNNYISSAKPYISVIDEDIRKVLEDGNNN